MADPMILGTLTLALEKVINGALRYDPGTRAALAKLAGKVLAIESTFPPLTLYLCPQSAASETALEVHAYYELPADTALSGPLPAIFALTFDSQHSHSLADSGVEVRGNTGLLSDFQDIMGNIDIDWEEPVNEVLGNTLGHPFAELLRSQFQWINTGTSKAQRFMGEYLTEELRATPGKRELESFYDDVAQLRSAADRLSARIQLLRQQASERQGE